MTSTIPFAEVIGDPIEHSLSPTIHRFWLDQAGIEARYERRKVARGALSTYLEERRADEHWRGANVTMPLKLDAIVEADEATDRAVAAGAANILIPREGKLIAANSDIGAVMLLLARLYEAKRAMRRVILFGTGGAARAVLVAARSVGLTPAIVIHARDMAAAKKLSVEFGLRQRPMPMDAPVEGDAVINATPLGMKGKDCLNCSVAGLSDEGWVFDLVSAPAETELILAARERGLAAVDGIDMLVEQAAASFELFFEAEPPRAHDEKLFAMLRR